MKFGYAPDLTEEEIADLERRHRLVDEMIVRQEDDLLPEFFKKENMDGVRIYPPGVKPPLTLWQQMKDAGEV
ncbi:MAG: hypothetical protein HQL66_05635 [Magnetococcales bacterium]|nr:hypothetical protein [Magnetococcales bacterium]